MAIERVDAKVRVRTKKKGHPIGKLGVQVKKGFSITFVDFFRVYDQAVGLPRVGENSIRP